MLLGISENMKLISDSTGALLSILCWLEEGNIITLLQKGGTIWVDRSYIY